MQYVKTVVLYACNKIYIENIEELTFLITLTKPMIK